MNFPFALTDRVFVFVVCGGREHIETLNFSLAQLAKRTKYSIIVVTDSARNEAPIAHDHIIDVVTPKDFNHHQASIFLKTSLHKILPPHNRYCYLDTDVICVSRKADAVFDHYVAPVAFASDHSTIRQFSPSAIYCHCEEKESDRIKADEEEIRVQRESYSITGEAQLRKQKFLLKRLDEIKTNKLRHLPSAIRFNLSRYVFRLTDDLFYDKKRHYWFDSAKKPVHYDSEQALSNLIEHHTSIYWEPIAERWNRKDRNIYEPIGCDHLVEEIKTVFRIEITDKNWTHWNGGVFLFDDSSTPFLDAWHEKTMHIFNNPRWQTRDQGTLAATTWEFGLQHHPRLSKDFNFLADYYNDRLRLTHEGKMSDDYLQNIYDPKLIHIYHHWADKNWFIWQWLEKKLSVDN